MCWCIPWLWVFFRNINLLIVLLCLSVLCLSSCVMVHLWAQHSMTMSTGPLKRGVGWYPLKVYVSGEYTYPQTWKFIFINTKFQTSTSLLPPIQAQSFINYPPASEASSEVANLTDEKNLHTLTQWGLEYRSRSNFGWSSMFGSCPRPFKNRTFKMAALS